MCDKPPYHCQLCESRGMVWMAAKRYSYRKHLTGYHDSDLQVIPERRGWSRVEKLEGEQLQKRIEALKRGQRHRRRSGRQSLQHQSPQEHASHTHQPPFDSERASVHSTVGNMPDSVWTDNSADSTESKNDSVDKEVRDTHSALHWPFVDLVDVSQLQ